MSEHPQIPEAVGDKAYWFLESSHGTRRVTLVRVDGRRVQHVSLAGLCIVKDGSNPVESPVDLDFAVRDIIDAVPEVQVPVRHV